MVVLAQEKTLILNMTKCVAKKISPPTVTCHLLNCAEVNYAQLCLSFDVEISGLVEV